MPVIRGQPIIAGSTAVRRRLGFLARLTPSEQARHVARAAAKLVRMRSALREAAATGDSLAASRLRAACLRLSATIRAGKLLGLDRGARGVACGNSQTREEEHVPEWVRASAIREVVGAPEGENV